VSVWVKGHMYESCDTYMSHVTHTQYTIHNTQCSKEFVCRSECMSQGTHVWVMWHMTDTYTRKSLSAGVSLWVKCPLTRDTWNLCLPCLQEWVYESNLIHVSESYRIYRRSESLLYESYVCRSESMSHGTHVWVMWHVHMHLSCDNSQFSSQYSKEFVCRSESMSQGTHSLSDSKHRWILESSSIHESQGVSMSLDS